VAHVALLAKQPLLAREQAETLAASDRRRAVILAEIAIAEGDGRAAMKEIERLVPTASEAHDASERAIDRGLAALRASALVLSGGAQEVDAHALDGGIVRVTRMIPRAEHRVLVVRCAAEGVDPVLVAHVAAEYLHRTFDEEIASISRSAAFSGARHGYADGSDRCVSRRACVRR